MNIKTIAIASVLAFTGAGAIAAETQTRSVRVSFADLDLTQAAGRATLERRVGRAVGQVCERPSVSDFYVMKSYRACRKAAWSGARRDMAAIYGHSQFAGRSTPEVVAPR